MSDNKRLNVQFGIDINEDEVNVIKDRLSKARQGTSEYSAVFDDLLRLHKHYITRLDGEAVAYMSVARRQLKEFFDIR